MGKSFQGKKPSSEIINLTTKKKKFLISTQQKVPQNKHKWPTIFKV